MSLSPFIVDVTEADFQSVVIEGSHEHLVLVDFWADWCQPCKMLLPLLSALAEEYGGKFVLAKVNSDREQGLAVEHGVRSIPTVIFYQDGRPVDQFMGMQPESSIRAQLEKYLPGPEAQGRQAAQAALAAGDAAQAVSLLEAVLEDHPDRQALKIDLAKALIQAGRADEAEIAIKTLPMDLYEQASVRLLEAQLHFARAVGKPDALPVLKKRLESEPDDPEALHRLGCALILEGEHQTGLDKLIQLMRQHRRYGDDAGHKALLAAFELLGARHPLVNEYRRKMMALMY
ncbi:thioredoxin [Ectothiorhodospira lacustris]|uniref:thioredoxin n=1 Tax=Ectothiorhodospira lacustris TaxID=2899127 RepID=UPI001EE7F322|nr:thioredoxin [Ectothiorhodospira lacustris]MCG5500431.1 thioredoxin [Ectothiorhodospira lacustris]MCG5509990.1 thioredoxin [Ectothiorhodospira lacustris]MCG5521736.1 thioredoxin [Ectothiorhodospira lacustris]